MGSLIHAWRLEDRESRDSRVKRTGDASEKVSEMTVGLG